jgi:hypothetical protein
MRRLLPLAFLLGASALPAQSFWDSQARFGPQFFSYDIKVPVREKISQRVDISSAGADSVVESDMSGLTDTQLRANYTIGQDFVVLTAGLNLPTGSATVKPDQLEAATRIGSDFLTFPISGFGSGFGVTGGVAVARPVGAWNVGFGASLRHAAEYEPFEDATGTPLKYQPGPEYRARIGADHPFGTGRMSFGLTFSKFGDDKANAASYNTGDRYVGQFALSNSLGGSVDYSFVLWNLYRTSGRLIDQSESPSGNITNGMIIFGVRGPGDIGIEPSIESRLWTQQGAKTSFLSTLGMRFVVNRGTWGVVPGFGFTIGSLESATLTGFRGTLAIRVGGGG